MKKRKKVANKKTSVTKELLAGVKVKTDITPMLISVAETVGLTTAEIISCENKKELVAAIKKGGLYDRASKKIGMTDEMIASYSDAESLKKACDGMHSKSNPDARIKEGVQPVPPKFAQNRPDFLVLESVLHAKFVLRNRVQFDEGNLQSFLRHVNRKYGSQKPVRIVKDVSFEVVKHELVTRFTIFFK